MFSGKKKCLTEFELGAYIDGDLPSEKRESIENHFADCKKCWNEFLAVRQAISASSAPDAEEVPARMIKKVADMFPEKSSLFDIVLNFVSDAVRLVQCSADFTQLTLAPAGGFRGRGDTTAGMVVLKRSFEEINVELDMEKISDDLCNIGIYLDEGTPEELLNALRVDLLSEGRELFSGPLKNGEAMLEDVSAGKYTINIHKGEKIYGEISLKIQ